MKWDGHDRIPGGHLRVGDYVGEINNDWMKYNHHLLDTTIAKELWGYDGLKPLGIVVKVLGSYAVDVLTSDGIVVRRGEANLQVIAQ